VDHGLQPDSDTVAQKAADLCKRLGLEPVRISRVTVGSAGGPEAAARTARYAALQDEATATGADVVLWRGVRVPAPCPGWHRYPDCSAARFSS
jgi:tRNA(Ile)-lysidine synthase